MLRFLHKFSDVQVPSNCLLGNWGSFIIMYGFLMLDKWLCIEIYEVTLQIVKATTVQLSAAKEQKTPKRTEESRFRCLGVTGGEQWLEQHVSTTWKRKAEYAWRLYFLCSSLHWQRVETIFVTLCVYNSFRKRITPYKNGTLHKVKNFVKDKRILEQFVVFIKIEIKQTTNNPIYSVLLFCFL